MYKLVIVAVVAGLVGCASTPSTLLAEAPAPEQPYRIGPGDRLQVHVWKNPELSVEVPVRPDGKISVPLLDDITAAGLTSEELKAVIAKELSEYVANADVTVIVVQTNSRRVSVLGEVARPGPLPLGTNLRVVEALSAAGGFGPFADRSAVKVIRYVDGKEQVYLFDFDAFVSGKAPETNILLKPGDMIVVSD